MAHTFGHMKERVLHWVQRWPAASTATILVAIVGFTVALMVLPQMKQLDPSLHSYTVRSEPLASYVTLSGILAPGEGQLITAPFDGTLRQVAADYGQWVEAGDLLISLDDSEIQRRIGTAKISYLNADQTLRALDAWGSGSEVAKAQRAVSAGEYSVADARRRLAETKRLLDRGLVARDEYEDLLQQLRRDNLALEGAKDELAATMRRGRGANRQIALIELRTAEADMLELARQAKLGVIHASGPGRFVRAPLGRVEEASALYVGQKVTRGQPLGFVASAESFSIRMSLDEADANRVRVGQRVTVTGPGFDGVLTGVIESVGGSAEPQADATASATFLVRAMLNPLTPSQRSSVRLGMNASVVVTTSATKARLTVPIEAVTKSASGEYRLRIMNPRTRRDHLVTVTVGEVWTERVEIRSGLAPGDIVVW